MMASISSKFRPFIQLGEIIKQLRNYKNDFPSIKLLNADKNLGLVALDTIAYHNLVLKHLNDTLTYLDLGLVTEAAFLPVIIAKAFYNLKNTCSNITLSDQEKKYISTLHADLPPFHILAKLRKTPISGRPIVGAVNWVTTPFSILLDLKLQPYLSDHQYILKNSQELKSH